MRINTEEEKVKEKAFQIRREAFESSNNKVLVKVEVILIILVIVVVEVLHEVAEVVVKKVKSVNLEEESYCKRYRHIEGRCWDKESDEKEKERINFS